MNSSKHFQTPKPSHTNILPVPRIAWTLWLVWRLSSHWITVKAKAARRKQGNRFQQPLKTTLIQNNYKKVCTPKIFTQKFCTPKVYTPKIFTQKVCTLYIHQKYAHKSFVHQKYIHKKNLHKKYVHQKYVH